LSVGLRLRARVRQAAPVAYRVRARVRGCDIRLDRVEQRSDRVDVQMVGRLVEEQHVVGREAKGGERHARLVRVRGRVRGRGRVRVRVGARVGVRVGVRV